MNIVLPEADQSADEVLAIGSRRLPELIDRCPEHLVDSLLRRRDGIIRQLLPRPAHLRVQIELAAQHDHQINVERDLAPRQKSITYGAFDTCLYQQQYLRPSSLATFPRIEANEVPDELGLKVPARQTIQNFHLLLANR